VVVAVLHEEPEDEAAVAAPSSSFEQATKNKVTLRTLKKMFFAKIDFFIIAAP
jgi:hypothetical protein